MQIIEKDALSEYAITAVDSNPRWGIWAPLAIAGCVLVLSAPVLLRLVGQWWSDPDYSHGFFVPFFSAYLIWSRRGSLAKLNQKATCWPIFLLPGAVGSHFLGSLAAQLF